ncbi:hypothetical protein JYU29_05770 [Tianweitania sp. BSSL-BM11]|uniref:Helix-turn-helix domain-containing protein n=1 Tax=Tianweitania aestuarii TaxID=2814886 RepID=A0ABS5RVF3_9HYPH|nr:hypothetical protein [Tianweitania aestuarii]MBS9720194.1 hypothetical protein [Tianweitania aestuarii]
MTRIRPSASLTFGAPASVAKGFAALPPAMQREGLLLMAERATAPALMVQASGLRPLEVSQLLRFPPKPFERREAEPIAGFADYDEVEELDQLPVRERLALSPAPEEQLKLMARDICPIEGVIPSVAVILDRAAVRHGYHGCELTDRAFRSTTMSARVDAYRLLLMLRDEMTISEIARLFGMGRNAIVCALKRVGWEAK